MKVVHDVDLFDRHILTAVPGEYDATPAAPLLSLDSWPDELTSSRYALAMGVCYLADTSGVLEVAGKFTPATAERLQDIYPHRPISPAPVHFAPADVPHSQLRSRVTTRMKMDSPVACDNTLHILRADHFIGRMASTRHLWISSNAVWSSTDERTCDDFHRLLSVMLLFSHDLNTRVFVLDEDVVPMNLDLAPYNRILRTVGLSVERSTA
ncbi:hypothetical protein [Kocuria sp. CPCC 205261]|uniref:hypothetical protein n=1 Tax=Kocuria sp. CPCC 205261 TaxID=3073554 RepID=UPI0034D77551